jgi:predicted ester cyclase
MKFEVEAFMVTSVLLLGVGVGPAFVATISSKLAAFPDGQYSMDDLIAEGDKVVLRWTFRGTHKGELMGIPATGEQVTMAGISIYHFANGMLAEIWENYDKFGLLQQLGVIPVSG